MMLKTEPRIKVENNKIFPVYAHAKMASRKREKYKIKPRIYVHFMLELDNERSD